MSAELRTRLIEFLDSGVLCESFTEGSCRDPETGRVFDNSKTDDPGTWNEYCWRCQVRTIIEETTGPIGPILNFWDAPVGWIKQQPEIMEAIERGQIIAAIKMLRNQHWMDLRQAKDFIYEAAGRS